MSVTRRTRHHNCFFYYRGPSMKGAAIERQVEDNTTKALINVLEHSDPSLTRSFLAAVLGETHVARIEDGTASFVLQASGPSSTRATGDGVPRSARWLLGLSTEGRIGSDITASEAQEGSRVDAAVIVPGRLLLAIEVKLGPDLDGPQLRRHAARWDIPFPDRPGTTRRQPAQLVLCRWDEIYRWVEQERGGGWPERTAFLLEQLAEYLRVTGLAPFTGFIPEDFDYFAVPPVERDGDWHGEVKRRLDAFWTAVRERLTSEEVARLGTTHVGQLPVNADHAWAQTNRGEPGSHLTAELKSDKVELNLTAWNAASALNFQHWLRGPEAPGQLSQLKGFRMKVFRRRAHEGPSGRPWWQRSTAVELLTVPVSKLNGKRVTRILEQCSALDPIWEKPAFHLRRSWTRQEALALGSDLADAFAGEMRTVFPVLLGVNAGVSAAPLPGSAAFPGQRDIR